MNKFLKIGCLALVAIFFIGLAFSAGFGLGVVLSSVSASPSVHKQIIGGSGDDQVALLSLAGIILSNPVNSPLVVSEGVIVPDQVGAALRLLESDSAIKAVVIRVDSPGGSAVASDEIYQSIKKFAAEKPVVVLMGDTAASGGYYISSAASYIIANPATVTGSIGVITEITDVQGLMKKLGLEQETYKSGAFKDLLSSTRKRTPEEQKMIQKLLDITYGLFVTRVAEGRKIERSKALELADGKIYSGKEAQQLGLVDAIGHQDDAFDKAKELAGIKEATFVDVSTKSFLELLFSQVKSANPLSALLPDLLLSRPGVKYLYR